MKKHISLMLAALCVALPLSSCGKSKTQPTPSVPIESSAPAETEAPSAATSTPQPQSETAPSATANAAAQDDAAVRAEIAKMIRDANELIEEGLSDDAKMALRDLRSRDLTDEEKEQVNALQAKLLSISD